MRNEEVKKKILDKIKEYDRIIISRHIRPDGDAVGSVLGLKKILQASFPEKEILIAADEPCGYVDFLGKEDDAVPESKYENALLIVVDTAVEDRISNKNYKLAKEMIKIDHHVDIKPFGDISWVEDDRAAACEMIVDLWESFKDELEMTKDAALCLYTGMVTDSGRFRFKETNGETFRCAAALLDFDIDTETLFAHLYLEEFSYLKYQSYVFKKMKITENGVAYIYVDKKMQKKFNLNHEQASETVSMLSQIKGSIIWIAFIDNEDETIRVRLRSRFVESNKLSEKFGGGGHLYASGANLHNKKEIAQFIKDADELSKDYKANNFYL